MQIKNCTPSDLDGWPETSMPVKLYTVLFF